MSPSSTEIETDDGFAVITLVTRLHAAAAAGRPLLAICEDLIDNGFTDSAELRTKTQAARYAYDRLAEIQATTP